MMHVNLNAFGSAGAYYEELVATPPAGVEFCGIHRLGDANYVSTPDIVPRALMYAEARGESFWECLDWPTLRPAVRGDLVHSNRLPLTHKPSVVTFDHVGFLTDFDHDRLYRLAETDVLTRYLSQARCAALLPWSDAAASGVRSLFGPSLPVDMDVLYPAVRPRETVAEQSSDTVELLFVATSFFLKGGMEVLAAFHRLRENHDVRLRIVADMPEEVRKQCSMDGVVVDSPTYSRAELYREVYANADVLVHPTHNDSFGMVLLEAMNAGLPVVATGMFAVPEIVDDGVTGLLVDRPERCLFREDGTPDPTWTDIDDLRQALQEPNEGLVNQLCEQLASLIVDPQRRRQFGAAGRERITDGRFSVERRNRRLAEWYASATQ